MYNNEKIGVGIITYNRKDKFKKLFDQVSNVNYIDQIVVVKNKDVDYGNNSPEKLIDNTRSKYIHVQDDLGVGFCKNQALKSLLDSSCDHLFLIEDDINIKNNNVFQVYIDTAKSFHLGHLNFCMAWDSITKKYLKPSYTVKNLQETMLSIFDRLCGDFEYFTKQVIQEVGMFNAKHYINALEHAEHTYRISCAGYTTPFHAFADIFESDNYIEDTGIESSIHHDQNSTQIYNQRIQKACLHFVKTYGRGIGQLNHPSQQEVKEYLENNH